MEMQDFLRLHRIPFDTSGHGKNRQGWLNLKCPFCHRNPYLGYNISGRYFNCWNSGNHSIYETLSLLTGLSSPEIRAFLDNLPKKEWERKEKPQGTLKLPNDLQPLLPLQRKYLKNRDFDPNKLIKLWGIQGIGPNGYPHAFRIFIPVYFRGEIVSWTTRRPTNNPERRYVSARPTESAIPIDQTLYGYDYVRNSVLLVEGPADTWAIGPGAVSSYGIRISPRQQWLLSKIAVRVVCFDSGEGEQEAERRGRDLANQLAVFPGKTILVKLETAKDAGSCSKQEIQDLRREFLS